MADKGPGAGIGAAAVTGGFLCLGLLFFCIAATIVLSLIPTFTANNSQQGYGSEYAFDALMLKAIFQNLSVYFNGSTVANSSDLSARCTLYLISQGYKNVAGCLIFNGRAWGPYNTSTNSRRRRRAPNDVGVYTIQSGRIFYTTSCPSGLDRNKTENSTYVSACVNQTLAQCNSLVNDVSNSFSTWSGSGLVLEILNTIGYYSAVYVENLFGVNRPTAVAIANTLTGVGNSTIGQLQMGCRYVGQLPISTINALLLSQFASNISTDVTTAPSG